MVTVEVRLLLLPTLMFPKLSVAGVVPNWPTGCDVPVPVTLTVNGELGALLVIEMRPDIEPEVVGA